MADLGLHLHHPPGVAEQPVVEDHHRGGHPTVDLQRGIGRPYQLFAGAGVAHRGVVQQRVNRLGQVLVGAVQVAGAVVEHRVLGGDQVAGRGLGIGAGPEGLQGEQHAGQAGAAHRRRRVAGHLPVAHARPHGLPIHGLVGRQVGKPQHPAGGPHPVGDAPAQIAAVQGAGPALGDGPRRPAALGLREALEN